MGVPGVVFLGMARRGCCSGRGCCLCHNVRFAGYAGDEVHEDVCASRMPVAEENVGSLLTVGHEGVGTLVGVIGHRAEACCLKHLVPCAVDRVVPRMCARSVAVLEAAQRMVAEAVHLFGL